MKLLKINVLLVLGVLLFSEGLMAQTGRLMLEVKGIKEAKGQLLIAVTSCEDNPQMVYGMVEVTSQEDITHTLDNVPVGKVDISLFQDLNENYELDMDGDIPDEPCCRKQKVKIQEGENKITVKLVNVKEMMNR